MTTDELQAEIARIQAEIAEMESAGLAHALTVKIELSRERYAIQSVLSGGPTPSHWPNRYGPAMPDWMKNRQAARHKTAPENDEW